MGIFGMLAVGILGRALKPKGEGQTNHWNGLRF